MFSDLVSNLDVFVKLKQSGSLNNSEVLYNTIKARIPVDLSDDQIKELKTFCRNYCSNLLRRWMNSHRKEEIFRPKNEEWLLSDIKWPQFVLNIIETNQSIEVNKSAMSLVSPAKTSIGVSTSVSTRKPFSELGPKQKKRRTELLETSLSSEEVAFLHSAKLRVDGYEDIAEIVEYLIENPHQAPKVKDFIFKSKQPLYSPEEALALMMSLKLSKWQYNTMRKSTQEKNALIYPSYYKIQQAKQDCYPTASENTKVTDYTAKVDLQSLLDVTTSRLLKSLIIDKDIKEMTLISKWGFDGASSQAIYKQTGVSEDDNAEFSDGCVFMGSLVPIRLTSGSNIIWENDSPNSANWCRPLFFKFIKESKFTILIEKNAMESEINKLKETDLGDIKIGHSLLLTMLDGKATSILSDASMQRCDLCKATPKEMNNIPLIMSKKIDTSCYQYGLSSLHLWIRFLECILHIAYRLDFKKWSVQTEEEGFLRNEKKKYIQKEFRERTGLLLDVVKEGHGTTNDGNTARRFFADSTTAASITGVDQRLIQKIYIILQAISSGGNINIPAFKQYTNDTMALFVELYSWFYMPSSVHKVLAHGAEIIDSFGLIPIGALSEEAAESRNKDFRRFRLHHSRKFCRKASNQDLLNNLLITSDPYLTMQRQKFVRKHKVISEEARKLLISSEDYDDYDKENFDFVNMDLLATTEDLDIPSDYHDE